ncbi:MAG: acyltransferase [Clostridia bacterium]|nr:acyltransferase [Clostridia bacterium]
MIKKAFRYARNIFLGLKFGNKIEKKDVCGVPLSMTVNIKQNSKLIVGRRVRANGSSHVGVIKGGQLIIEDEVYFNRDCLIVCQKDIRIGKNCSFGPGVKIYDHDHVFDTEGFRQHEFTTQPVRIEQNCWIGANSVILKGTTIGEGTVIGAGTVVRGTIPPHSLVTSGRELVIKPIEKR